MLWSDSQTMRFSLTNAAMWMNLRNESLFNIVVSNINFQSLWFSIVQTQPHYICLTGNFRKGIVRLNWIAKWVAAWKTLKITDLNTPQSGEVNSWQNNSWNNGFLQLTFDNIPVSILNTVMVHLQHNANTFCPHNITYVTSSHRRWGTGDKCTSDCHTCCSLSVSLPCTLTAEVGILAFFRPNFINLASFQVGWPKYFSWFFDPSWPALKYLLAFFTLKLVFIKENIAIPFFRQHIRKNFV